MQEKCKLCEEYTNLNKSHIIPEWGYKSLYDKKHRMTNTSIYEKKVYPGYMQNGAKEYLLCDKCEQRFSKLENYSKYFYNDIQNEKSKKIICNKLNDYYWIVENADYNLLKRFYLSVLFRMIISKNDMFKYYSLDESRLEKIRLYLLHDIEIPVSFFPILISKPYILNAHVNDLLMTQSHNGVLHGYPIFRVIFDGILFSVFISENITDKNILEYVLKDKFLIHRTNIDNSIDNNFIMKIFLENKKIQDFYFNQS